MTCMIACSTSLFEYLGDLQPAGVENSTDLGSYRIIFLSFLFWFPSLNRAAGGFSGLIHLNFAEIYAAETPQIE